MYAKKLSIGIIIIGYSAVGIFCGMLVSELFFMVVEGFKRISTEFNLSRFISGVDDVLAVTFLFLVGAAFSSVFSFPVGFLVAADGWRSTDIRTQRKALCRVFLSTTMISFIVVSLYFHRTIEQLKNT